MHPEPLLRACHHHRIRAGEAAIVRGIVVTTTEVFQRIFPDATPEEYRCYDGDGWKWTRVVEVNGARVIFRAYGQ